MPELEYSNPGHGHYPAKRQTGACPSGKAYYVCAAGPFKGCCSSDPCSTGWYSDYHDPAWQPSTTTEYVTQTQTQTAVCSYTLTVTMTLSDVTSDEQVTSTMSASGSNTDSPLVSSVVSEISASSSITASHSSKTTSTAKSGSNTYTSSSSSSTTSPFLSIITGTNHNGTLTSAPRAGTVAGIALGSAGTIALLFLFCCICCHRRKKGWSFKYNKKEEDQELKKQLKEAATVQAERNKALRALENRRTGVGSDGAWASSPRHSTGFPGMRREG